MFTKGIRTLHQYTGAGTSNQELDRRTLISHLPDSFLAPSGTIWEGVDRSTLELVAHLFPAETCGRVFFARFFERAAVEKSVIPDVAKDTVYICTQSIASLGKELGFSNDTTHKYVKLSMALGLLRKQKFMGQLAFLLFVGIYHPPQTLEGNLDSLIQKSRPKLHDMAVDVKARCQIYGLISQDLLSSLEQLQALLHVEKGASRRTLEQRLAQAQHITSKVLRAVLTSPLPAESPQTDGTRRRKEHTLLENLPKDGDRKGDTTSQENQESPQWPESERQGKERSSQNLRKGASQGDSVQGQRDEESSQLASPGRFSEEGISSRLPEKANQGDSGQHEHEGESPGDRELGRFPQPGASLRPPRSTDGGDSGQGGQRTHLAESPQEGSTSRFEEQVPISNPSLAPKQGDSSASVLTSNVNVITLISNITSNVKLVATFCRQALEEPPSKQRIYLNLFDECEHDAQAVTAALLFTLAHKRDGTMTKPAAVFIARCRDFHRQGVSEEAAAFVQQYGSLSYPQLLAALQKSAAPSTPSRQGTSSPGGPPRPATPASLPPLPQWGTIPRLIEVSPSRTGMSRQEALQVVARARGDRRTKLCRVDLEQLAGGTYAVLLDNTITTVPRQTYFYSLREWETRTATIKDCFELFGVAPIRRRCLADSS